MQKKNVILKGKAIKVRVRKNRDIVQAHTITKAKYNFNVYEKRILYRTMEFLQSNIRNKDFPNENSHGLVEVILQTASIFPKGESYSKNHKLIKKALFSLLKKTISFEDKENNRWHGTTVVVEPDINRGIIKFLLNRDLYKALLAFSQYNRFNIETAMSFRSVYSMRFYEQISYQTKVLTYDIDTLKTMFELSAKYKQIRPFITHVIDVAKKELDSKAPYSFNYELIKEGKKIQYIKFFPVYLPNNRSDDQKKLAAAKTLEKKIDISEFLTPGEIISLKELGFTENRLKKHLDLLEAVSKARRRGTTLITPTLIWYVHKNANNKQGYFLKALRNNISELEESEQKTLFNNAEKSRSSVKTDKELDSVTSFLQGFIGLIGEKLTNGIIFVMNKGGSSYLNELFSLDKSKEDLEVIKVSLIDKIVNYDIRESNGIERAINDVLEAEIVKPVKVKKANKSKSTKATSITPNINGDETIVEEIQEPQSIEALSQVEAQSVEGLNAELNIKDDSKDFTHLNEQAPSISEKHSDDTIENLKGGEDLQNLFSLDPDEEESIMDIINTINAQISDSNQKEKIKDSPIEQTDIQIQSSEVTSQQVSQKDISQAYLEPSLSKTTLQGEDNKEKSNLISNLSDISNMEGGEYDFLLEDDEELIISDDTDSNTIQETRSSDHDVPADGNIAGVPDVSLAASEVSEPVADKKSSIIKRFLQLLARMFGKKS